MRYQLKPKHVGTRLVVVPTGTETNVAFLFYHAASLGEYGTGPADNLGSSDLNVFSGKPLEEEAGGPHK